MMKSKAVWWTTGIFAVLGLATDGLEGFTMLGISGFVVAWAVVKYKAYMTPERRQEIKARRVAKKEAHKGQKSLLTKMVESQVQAENRKASIQRTKLKEKMKCPRCGSKNIQLAGQHRKGFSVGKAVGGAALTGGIGALAGFAGKQTKKSDWVCLDCGRSFTIK
ncbi:hypothetical protein [Limosilactobacillus fermentum]|uniref:hypothetical protein n=1 Tax=Limosilactobacillus fermentum TaxID=1613 RepID=UPI00207937CA|nr:hypothetical protein [Limosilactobacillus fermentum]